MQTQKWPLMAVNGGHAGKKEDPNWGHVNLADLDVLEIVSKCIG